MYEAVGLYFQDLSPGCFILGSKFLTGPLAGHDKMNILVMR